MANNNFARKQGAGAFGTRLRRLSERLDRSVANVYEELGVTFSPRWFPVVRLLATEGPKGITELAKDIGLSHVAISQVSKALIANEICDRSTDPNDQRRNVLRLTPKGKRLTKKLEPVWGAVQDATEDLLGSAAPSFLEGLNNLDAALDQRDMKDRIEARLSETRRNS